VFRNRLAGEAELYCAEYILASANYRLYGTGDTLQVLNKGMLRAEPVSD